MKNNKIKKTLLLGLNVSILAFLVIVGSITFYHAANVSGKSGLVIPDDSLVYQGRLLDLSVTRDADKITVESEGRGTIYLLNTDTEVLSGSKVELEVPTLSFKQNVSETSAGVYSIERQEKLIITPQVAGVTLDEMSDWQIQPLEESIWINDKVKSETFEIKPIRISTLESALDSDIQKILSQFPVVDYIAEANISAAQKKPQRYELSLGASLKVKILDKDGNPIANKDLSARFELPNHNYSETVSATTDSDGILSYSRTEKAIIKVSGGNLTTLAQPLEVEGSEFLAMQWWWWEVTPPGEGEPDYNNQDEAGEPNPENQAGDDPINLATGNVYSIEQDLFIPGKGLPIQFTRAYNSQVNYQGPLGFGRTHSYNIYLTEEANGDVKERDEDGTLLTFARRPDGTYESPAGNHDTLTKHPDGTYALRRKHGVKYNFDTGGKLTTIVDPNGNQVTLSYSGNDLVKITDTGGREVTLAYDSQHRIIRLTDPLNRTTTYTYDSDNNLSSVTDPLGNKTTYEYNEYHCIKTVTEPQRETYEGEPVQGHRYFSYDSDGRCEEFKYDENNHKITLEYESGKTTITDSRDNKTIHYYTEISDIRLVTKIIDATDHTQLFTWDNDLNKTSSTDQNGQKTNMAYDVQGNLTSITDPLGKKTNFTYESTYNKCTSITDPLGNKTTYEYDANGNLTQVTDAQGNTTTYTYDSYGNLASMTDANGNRTDYQYDAYGNLTTVIDPLGIQTGFAYDLVGNSTQITDAKGNATSFAYDAMNRLVQITYPDNTKVSYTYDEVGNRTSITDPKENVTSYAYDAVNRLVGVNDPLDNITRYSYDTEGNRVRITDANRNATTYTYDSLNRLTKGTDPLGNSNTYTYDPAGNRITTTDANVNTIQYAYDAVNRLTTITYPDASEVSFAYDATGKRTSMTDSQGITVYEYDELNRLVKVTAPGAHNSITYFYDAVGNRTSMTNQDGGITTYKYDALNRLVWLGDPKGKVTEYSYDEVSNLTAMSYPNGAKTEYTFDNLNRLLSLVNKKTEEEAISSYSYEYDQAGMRTKVTLENGDYITYTYDELNRLASEIKHKVEPSDRIYYNYKYTFDAVGNRTSMTRFLQKPPFSDKENKKPDVWELPGKSYFEYAYDKDNRLSEVVIRRGKGKGGQEPPGKGEGEAEFEADEILVKFKPDTPEEKIKEINAKHGTKEIERVPRIGVHRLQIPAGVTPEEIVKQYQGEVDVEYAEQNYIAHALIIPNDPDFSKQWGLDNIGQTGGTPDADIDAPEAWDIQTGKSSVVIAIIDTGCDQDHPDLAGKFTAGHDFVNDDSDPQDDHGHGTYCAGIASAVTNNGIGVAGVSWYSQIMPVKVLDSGGSGSYSDVAAGIIYAADNGADVISMSLGGSSSSDTLEDAMEYAYNSGVVIACATGNDNGPVSYPAAYDEYCLGVAATDHNDQRASFSNYGPQVDVAAPGVNVYSASWDNTYKTASGTSASTPFVSGLAALLLARDATLTPDEVKEQIKSTCDDVNSATYPGEDVYLGAGRINAYNALTVPPPKPPVIHATIQYTYDNNGNQIKEFVTRGKGKGKGNQSVTAYAYDYENRLTTITYDDGSTSEYLYDGVGKRIQSVEDGQVTKYLCDGLNAIIERNASNATIATYIRGIGYGGGIGSIISASRGPDTYYYHYDGIGSVAALTDGEGEVEQSYIYDAYGNILAVKGDVTNPYRFSTKEYTPQSGLVYFGARYYDAKIGRFITLDPLTWGPDDVRILQGLRISNLSIIDGVVRNRGIVNSGISTHANLSIVQKVGGLNPSNYHGYIYVFNNPTNCVDPWGLDTYGIGYTLSGGCGLGGQFQVLAVWDDKGNYGTAITVGGGGYLGVGVSSAFTFQYTTADTIYDLRGTSVGVGVAGGVGIWGGGYEFIAGDNYTGHEVSIGVGFSPMQPFSFAMWANAYYTWVK